jgi:hypothetical protein
MLALRARIFALLAAIALMLPSGAAARAAYFCRMMERVMPSCCCRGAHAAHAAREEARQAKASSPDCCERFGTPSRAPASAAACDAALQVPSAALLSLLPIDVVFAAPALVGAERGSQARAPPRGEPPLFIVHCALLS